MRQAELDGQRLFLVANDMVRCYRKRWIEKPYRRFRPSSKEIFMPFARIDLAQGKSPEYRATVGEIVYEGIVKILKAPDGDRFMIIGEHAPENFVYDPNFLDIKRSPDLISGRLRHDT
jgi:hypothetical protein